MSIGEAQKSDGKKGANDSELNALKERQEQLKFLIDHSSVGRLLSKNKGTPGAILVSDTVCNLVGLSEKELKNETIASTVHPDDIPLMQKGLNELHDGKRDSFSLKTRLFSNTGKIIWTHFTVTAVRDAAGKVIYEVGSFEVITEEWELKDRLKHSESLLTKIFADLPIGLLIENGEGKIILTNKKFCNMFDLEASPEQLIGSDSRVIAEQSKWKVRNPDQYLKRRGELLEKKSAFLIEEIVFVDGRVFELEYVPLTYEGNDTGCMWGYKEITDKKNLEYKLEKQKGKYQTIIENMNLGWTETDPDGIILTANKVFCEFSGYSLEELTGKNGVELLLVETSKDKTEYYNDKSIKAYTSQVVPIKTKSGKIKHLLVSGLRLHDSKGELVGSLGIQFDITDHKKLELQKDALLKELESQNEQLNDYAHVVSHDLKSPLRSISALLAWTKEDFSKNLGEAGLKNLNLIDEKVEKMDLLIEKILEYSSLDKTQINKESIDLDLVIKDILKILYVPKDIQVNVLKNLPVIYADTARIHQLFQNLIDNAVNHVDKRQGIIEIDFTDTGTHYQFAVKDNGTGIEKKYHDKIFKVFKSFDDREMSTGIGLSIVKKIVDQYDGEIWLESEVGLGTTFFFTLKKQS